MRICSIASGSSGNCTYIGTDTTHLLVDAGVSCKRVMEGVAKLGLSPKDIDGVFVTHEHIDHIAALGVMSRKYGKLFLIMDGWTIKHGPGMNTIGL